MRPKPFEYSVKVDYCKIMKKLCDLGGNCHNCEYAIHEKDMEKLLESSMYATII